VTAADPNPDYSLFGSEQENGQPPDTAEDSQRESANTSKYATWDAGDTVEYGDGQKGMVGEIWTGNFDWPTGEEDGETTTEEIEASQDDPVYLVIRESGGSKPYSESELSDADDWLSDAPGGDPDQLAEEGETSKLYDIVDDPLDASEVRIARQTINKLNVPGQDDPEVGFAVGNYPNGWTQTSFIKCYRTCGSSWTGTYNRMKKHFGPRRARRFASALKDQCLGFETWRNRF
jgi:hypothetical protein